MGKLTDSAASPVGAWTGSDHHVLTPATSMLPEAGVKGGAATGSGFLGVEDLVGVHGHRSTCTQEEIPRNPTVNRQEKST
jgi:hypothetical protein